MEGLKIQVSHISILPNCDRSAHRGFLNGEELMSHCELKSVEFFGVCFEKTFTLLGWQTLNHILLGWGL